MGRRIKFARVAEPKDKMQLQMVVIMVRRVGQHDDHDEPDHDRDDEYDQDHGRDDDYAIVV